MFRRLPFFFVLFCLLGAGLLGATDENCFDHERWRQAVRDGDAEAALDALEKGVGECVCETETNSCLPFPGSGKLLAPAWLRDVTERLVDWQKTVQKSCGSLEESDKEKEQAKWKCYQDQARTFSDGLAGEADGRLISSLPLEIAEKWSHHLTQPPQGSKANDQAPTAKNYSNEAQEIGRRICLLDTRLQETQEILGRVKRRGSMTAAENQRRAEELEKVVKELNGSLLELRTKFQRLTGEVFNPYSFCGPKTDE